MEPYIHSTGVAIVVGGVGFGGYVKVRGVKIKYRLSREIQNLRSIFEMWKSGVDSELAVPVVAPALH